MHPIAAIDLPGILPAPLDGMAEPIFDRISPGDLLVDDSYQRGLSARSLRLFRSIVEGWDWLRFKPPVVAITDRGFEVIDGQDTAIATIPILALDGNSRRGARGTPPVARGYLLKCERGRSISVRR